MGRVTYVSSFLTTLSIEHWEIMYDAYFGGIFIVDIFTDNKDGNWSTKSYSIQGVLQHKLLKAYCNTNKTMKRQGDGLTKHRNEIFTYFTCHNGSHHRLRELWWESRQWWSQVLSVLSSYSAATFSSSSVYPVSENLVPATYSSTHSHPSYRSCNT